MRFFVGAIVHETNSFSPIPTTLRSFRENGLLHHAGDEGTRARALETDAFGDSIVAIRAAGDEVVTGLCAWAMPSGIVSRPAYESLRDELLRDIKAAGRLDAIQLFLHGAMVAEGYPDCEGDILEKVRSMVGPDVPIGALLDLHGNVSERMIRTGALLVACKEYPHTDYPERARELHRLLADRVSGRIEPRMLMQQVPMVAPMGTTEDPMRSFVARLKAAEGANGVLSVSAMHGFAWSDTADMGAAILVVYDSGNESHSEYAADLACQLAASMFAIRRSGLDNRLALDEAIEAALAARRETGPVILADSSDNPGGGAACDSTFVLEALLVRGVRNAALGMLWDPQAALIASDAGPGARVQLRIGGKVGPLSGRPLDLVADVLAVRDDVLQVSLGGHGGEPIGLAAAIRVEGVEIVLNSIRQQTFSPNCFVEMGIAVKQKSLVVVKSSQHFRAAFDSLAVATVYCNAPGSLNTDLAKNPYAHITRPIWPLDPLETPSGRPMVYA